jgi:16S rRNA (cytidine1402-2'-O)-methyltransferase
MTCGKLYLVATPIGNLEDISLRALRILREADIIAAEDTRRTQKLLNHYQIAKPLTSYYKDIEHWKTGELVERLLSGQSVALVTDAGMPGISDPGVLMVQACRSQGIPLEVIPGPSALMTALAGSGLPLEKFTFHGFPEAKSTARKKDLALYKSRSETQVFFVAPHRLEETLRDLYETWGDRQAVLCRELTKIHEEFQPGALSELLEKASRTEARGEYTVVIEGASADQAGFDQAAEPPESVEQGLARLQQSGLSLNQAVARIAKEKGLPRAQVYNLAHALKQKE